MECSGVDFKNCCFVCLNGGVSDSEKDLNFVMKLKEFAFERKSYGESEFDELCERFDKVSEDQLRKIKWHPECYKNVTHKGHTERAKKRFLAGTSSKGINCNPPKKKGRPSKSDNKINERRERRKRTGEEHFHYKGRCVFPCDDPTGGKIHRIEYMSRCERIILIKEKTKNETLRVNLSHIHEPLDCIAYDISYHRDCMRNEERKIAADLNQNSVINKKLGMYIADTDIIKTVKSCLSSDQVITMNEINEEYNTLLVENGIEGETADYKKHRKKLISQSVDGVQFVSSPRMNESDRVMCESTLNTAIEEYLETHNDEENIKALNRTAILLRNAIANHDIWQFTGTESLENFKPPTLLTTFLRWVMIGTKTDINSKRSESSMKVTTVVSQVIMKNFKSNRQVSYQPKNNADFRNRREIPLSIGTSLTVHKKTRSKGLVKVLSSWPWNKL